MKNLKSGLLLILALATWPLMAQTEWYNQAQARIDTLRKGNFTLRVKTPEGAGLTDSIRVVMKKHEFSWGYAVDLSGGGGDDWQKAIMLRYCNFGVNTNSFKWSGIEANKGNLTYGTFDRNVAWFRYLGWGVKGHTLLWGGSATDSHANPQWVLDLKTTPKLMNEACKERVTRDISKYKGIVNEYDVMNEATHVTFLQQTIGDSLNWNCYKWAHAADPTAKMYFNDYNIIEYGNQTDNFVTLLRRIIDNKGPVSGVGTQSHIGSTVDLNGFKTNLDKLAQFGLPIKVTEFDMNFGDGTVMTPALEKQYADEMGKMLRLCFSYPAMEGFIFWGMTGAWAKGVINPYRDDKTFRLAADTIHNLIKKQWSTDVKGKLDENGEFSFKGYYGTYEVQVKIGDEWKKLNASCIKANKGKTFDLSTGNASYIPPTLQEVTVVEPNQIHLRFDKVMSNPASKYSYFKVFNSQNSSVTSAALKPGDSKTVVLYLNSIISKRDYIPVAYLGNLTSSYTSYDGAVLEPFGYELTSNVSFITGFTASSSPSGRYIELSFPDELLASSVVLSDYVVTINGTRASLRSASLGTNKKVVQLELEKPLTKGTESILASYSNGSLKRLDGRFVAPFKSYSNTIAASNTVVPPKIDAVNVLSTGTSMNLSFNVEMGDATGLDSCFSLYSKLGQTYQVISATTQALKTKIVLKLSTPIYKGDSLSLMYTGNALSSLNGVQLENFTSSVANNSRTALTDVDDVTVSVTPNPFEDQLIVNHNGKYKTLVVTNLDGRVMLQQVLISTSREVISTSTWEQGVYMLTLTDGKTSTSLKVVKK
jgi:uncharacterized repeat protein (TIGR02059 family)